jgi:transaldolase
MTRLQELHEQQGQSPWLDDLTRDSIVDGSLARWVARGVRGVTSNPTIFQKAMTAGDAYDEQFRQLVADGASVEDAYWAMATRDIADALEVLRPVHRGTGPDGYVSLELSPALAHDEDGSVAAAARLHDQLRAPNLFVKIPATEEGVAAIRRSITAGGSTNVTLIFGLDRYEDVMEAYLAGLEAREGDLSAVASVASFFVSRVDVEVDRRLEEIGTEAALALRGRAAVAQAKLAYARFRARFSGPRWEALAARGAQVQRPLWASTSTKNPAYRDVIYVEELIGPDTVNTLPAPTIEAFEDHGVVARTVDVDLEAAEQVLADLARVGVDLDDVAVVLEREGVEKFAASYDELLASLGQKAGELVGR